ncbi:hypothetical protein GCM10009624_16210 [Gordonia sinesedis]
MTDFFALPGDYANVPIPERFRTPPTPMPSDDSMPGRVESTEAEWRKRASIAREGAEELREALQGISRVGKDNYFGDCAEGRNVANKLSEVMDQWRDDLQRQIVALEELASRCDDAARQYTEADFTGARDLQS